MGMFGVRHLLMAVLVPIAGASGCSDLCAQCDRTTEVCIIQRGCGFLQNGNPNPLGDPDSASCRPLPFACVETDGCPCAICPPGEIGDDCVAFAGCVDGAVIEDHGCM